METETTAFLSIGVIMYFEPQIKHLLSPTHQSSI